MLFPLTSYNSPAGSSWLLRTTCCGCITLQLPNDNSTSFYWSGRLRDQRTVSLASIGVPILGKASKPEQKNTSLFESWVQVNEALSILEFSSLAGWMAIPACTALKNAPTSSSTRSEVTVMALLAFISPLIKTFTWFQSEPTAESVESYNSIGTIHIWWMFYE